MKPVFFRDEPYTVEWSWYAKPRNRHLQLLASDGPMATASINPDVQLVPSVIAIKDFRENSGVLAALIVAGVVEDTGEYVRAGYERANGCRIFAAAE